MIALRKKARFLAVALTAIAAGVWFGAQANQLPADTQKTGNIKPNLFLPDALSSASSWILDFGDLSIADGACANRDGQDSKVHLAAPLPNDCELAFQVNWIRDAGATDRASAFAIHFGAAGAKDDIGDSGYAVVLMRNSSIVLARGYRGNPDEIGRSILAAWNAAPKHVKIVRAKNAIRVFINGTLKISGVDSASGEGGYLSLRTTRFPDLSEGRDTWRIENLSIKGYKR